MKLFVSQSNSQQFSPSPASVPLAVFATNVTLDGLTANSQ
jgi:hypothetical protein